jgi:hypothetical protein
MSPTSERKANATKGVIPRMEMRISTCFLNSSPANKIEVAIESFFSRSSFKSANSPWTMIKLAGYHEHPKRLGHVSGVAFVCLVPRVLDDLEPVGVEHKTNRRTGLNLISPPKATC